MPSDDEPETFEKEPNDTPSEAETVSIPVTINGHIDNPAGVNRADDDYFRIHAARGQHLVIEVAACPARVSSGFRRGSARRAGKRHTTSYGPLPLPDPDDAG